jgi:hypothetical protein
MPNTEQQTMALRPANPQQGVGDLQRMISDADTELQQYDPSPFSDGAFARLKEKVSEYIVQLVMESTRVARRHQADTVSGAHVERASEYLISNTSRRIFRHLGTAGGILLGASISNFLSMTTTNQFATGGILISASLGIVGAFMVALHMAKE